MTATLALYGQDADTGASVGLAAESYDDCVYMSVDDGRSCVQIAMPKVTARQFAEFLLKETS